MRAIFITFGTISLILGILFSIVFVKLYIVYRKEDSVEVPKINTLQVTKAMKTFFVLGVGMVLLGLMLIIAGILVPLP